MEAVLAVGLTAALSYLIWAEIVPQPPSGPRDKTLVDYSCCGGVYEDPEAVIRSGRRMLEVHLYSDENDKPIVTTKPLDPGYDYAYDYLTFDAVCVALIQAFPSPDPFILSIVPHTTKTRVLNAAADVLKTTLHRQLVNPSVDVLHEPIDRLADKLLLVSESLRGSELGEMINLSWTGSSLRRLTYMQATHPRDVEELVAFNKVGISLVAPDPLFGKVADRTEVYGCQWRLFGATPGFVEK